MPSTVQPASASPDGAATSVSTYRDVADRDGSSASAELIMDSKLRCHLASMKICGSELPMDMGSFYERDILNHRGSNNHDAADIELNVRASSYKSVSKWLSVMEGEGLILLKKHKQTARAYRKKASTKSVVAVGKEQIELFKDHQLAELQPTNKSTGDGSEPDDSSSDDDDSTDEISINPTLHARRRQKERGITDKEIKKAIGNAKAPKRRSDGVKVLSAGDIGLVVAGGQKNRIITTWKEAQSSDGGYYLDRWTSLTFADDRTDGYLQQQAVSVVETFQRYEMSGCRIGNHGRKVKTRWEAGARVRKNNKYRKNILVIGLQEQLIPPIVKQIQNHMALHVKVGTLRQEEWDDMFVDNDSPVSLPAAEGSNTISFILPDGTRMLSRALRHIEAVVPPKYRNYWKEEKEDDLTEGGVPVWRIKNMTTASREKHEIKQMEIIESVGSEIVELYGIYAPDKVEGVPKLLEQYRGKERALLQAVQRKYEECAGTAEKTNGRRSGNEVKATEQNMSACVNVEDLLGEWEKEGDDDAVEGDNVFPQCAAAQHPWEDEGDLATYF